MRGHPAGRRRFMRIALVGGAATLVGMGLPAAPVRAAGEADALLLSCTDFRLIEETERYMSGRGLRHKYDHVIFAGASLGALTGSYPRGGKPSGNIWRSPSSSTRFTGCSSWTTGTVAPTR